jgi:hypothetical protein
VAAQKINNKPDNDTERIIKKKKEEEENMAPTQTVACKSAKDDPAHCWTEFRLVCV